MFVPVPPSPVVRPFKVAPPRAWREAKSLALRAWLVALAGQRGASQAEKTDLEKRHDSGEEDMEIEKEDKERKV